MADKITGYGGTGVDITAARSRGAVRNERAAGDSTTEAASQSTSQAETGSGAVRLTDTATNLKQIESQIARLPDVDRARVEAVRQRIEAGSYQVDHGRLADRLLAFERDLA